MAMHQPELDFGSVTDLAVTLRRVGKRNLPSVQNLDKDISKIDISKIGQEIPSYLCSNLLGAEIA